MKKIVGDWRTILILENDEPKKICKLGQRDKCCPWLVMGEQFECWRMNYPNNISIAERIKLGTMNAKGKECNWDKLSNSIKKE